MSVNKEFGEAQQKRVADLVKHSSYNKSTNHATFDAGKLDLPKDITTESLSSHINFINELSGQVEVATSEIARTQYEDNKKLTTIDSTLNLGSLSFNSQHHLKQQVGEDWLFGLSTTAMSFNHSEEQAEWLQEQRTASQEQAAKLFG